MKITRLLFVLSFIIIFTILLFTAYTQFLIDYSLENLQFSLKASAEKNAAESSPLVNGLYGALVEGQALENIAEEKTNLSQLALIEMASRSFEEASFRNSYQGAKLYLRQITQHKISLRHPLLRVLDRVNERIAESLRTLVRYFRRRFEPQRAGIPLSQFSNDLLLNHAQELEKKGDLQGAAGLYRKYIALYPKNANLGFVSVALANLLIRQAKLSEAETLLQSVSSAYFGLEEGDLAARFLKKIDFIKQGTALLPRLKTLLGSAKNDQVRNSVRLKLGLTHLSLYQLPAAEENLKALLRTKDPQMQSKAKFYLGWIYRLKHQYGEGEHILLDLLDDPNLAPDLELGLHAGLADIYYQQNDSKKALKQYQILKKKSVKEASRFTEKTFAKASQEAWLGVSELETSNIYYFNLNDATQGAQHLAAAGQALGVGPADAEELSQDNIKSAPATDLRTRAFRALEMRQISLAYELFSKNAIYHPTDAWTYGGLSTIYVLLGDMSLALENAERSYRLANDEYTASALGYVYGLVERYEEAAAFYRQAIQHNNSYFPAKFNLSYNYLKLKEYEKALEILSDLDRRFGGINTTSRAKVRNNMGFALWKLGKREEAIQKFREALKINPDFLVAKKNINFSAGKSPEAAA